MAKRAKKKAKRAKTQSRKAKATRAKRAGARRTAAKRRVKKRVSASPSGRIGARRPSNQPKFPGKREPRELAQAEPDARFGDQREPEGDAREEPEGSVQPLERLTRYKNTDENF